MIEKLVDCRRCNSNACSEITYEQGENKIIYNLCFGCGFLTNSHYYAENYEQIEQNLPELYKDLRFIDGFGLAWYPSLTTLPDKSMIFAEGRTVGDWSWSAVKAKKIPKKDIPKFKGETHMVDMKTKKEFPQNGFMDALEYINYFNNQK